jgi:hypothetical protein
VWQRQPLPQNQKDFFCRILHPFAPENPPAPLFAIHSRRKAFCFSLIIVEVSATSGGGNLRLLLHTMRAYSLGGSLTFILCLSLFGFSDVAWKNPVEEFHYFTFCKSLKLKKSVGSNFNSWKLVNASWN